MKQLFIILLFVSNAAAAQLYFVIPSKSEDKVKAITRQFYALSRPSLTDTTKYLFSFIKHPLNDSLALVLDTTISIPKGGVTSTHVTAWINELYPTLTTTQRNTLTTYINSNSVLRISRLILTARVRLWTEADLKQRGWF